MKIFLIFIVALFSSLSVYSKEFTVGVEMIDYRPYYNGTTREYSGYSAEIFKLIEKHSNNKFSFKRLPVKRLFKEFYEGAIDFKFPDNPLWDKKNKESKQIRYSLEIAAYIDGMMVLPEYLGGGIENLKRIGTIRGFTPWDYIGLEAQHKIYINKNSSFTGLLNHVLLKRIDGAYINVDVCRYKLKTLMNKENALVFDSKLPHTKGSYFISTMKYPEVSSGINSILTLHVDEVNSLKKRFHLIKTASFEQD